MNTLPTDFLIVVGTPQRLRIDLGDWGKRAARAGVAEDLAAVGLGDPCRLAYTFVTGEEALDAYLGEGPLNTDDRPVLSYWTYGANFRSTIAGNLLELLKHRTDVGPFVSGWPDESTRLRHYAAAGEVLLGHVYHQLGDHRQAILHYVSGAELLPADALLRGLIRHECRRHVQAH
jgi:hypothetical protein